MRTLLFALAVLALSCQGFVSDIDPRQTGGGNTAGGAPGGTGGGPGNTGGGSSGGGSPAACQVARAPLTRLNTQEFDATLASLVGDTLKPARFFPADVITPLHFDNDATQLAIAPGLVQGMEAGLDAVVDAAWTRDAALSDTKQRRLQLCTPSGASAEASCAQQILSGFARRAWRRPASSDELKSLTDLYDATRKDGDDFASAVKLAAKATLLSPNFLLRTEAVVPNGQAASSFAVASRLSYFLWGTMPDDTLAGLADSGQLTQKDVLDAQITRLLADPQAASLKTRFVSQWFGVGNVEGVALDPGSFQGVTPAVMKSMRKQIDAFLNEFFFTDRDAVDFLDAPVTYVDGTLATFLGMTKTSDDLVRVTLPAGDPRSGLLGQSAPLVVTSKTTMTNVPKRGNYILERLVCTPLAPPAGVVVPPVPDATSDQPTVRQRLDILTSPSACDGCHKALDPPGYALEVYQADSRLRTKENGATIDTSGMFGTESFDDAAGLKRILKADARVPGCMVDRTLSFALGRRLARDGSDASTVATLTTAFNSSQHRFQSLLVDAARTAAGACQ